MTIVVTAMREGTLMSELRWNVLLCLVALIPATICLFRRREDSEWGRTTAYVGLFLIVVGVYILVFDPVPRNVR